MNSTTKQAMQRIWASELNKALERQANEFWQVLKNRQADLIKDVFPDEENTQEIQAALLQGGDDVPEAVFQATARRYAKFFAETFTNRSRTAELFQNAGRR